MIRGLLETARPLRSSRWLGGFLPEFANPTGVLSGGGPVYWGAYSPPPFMLSVRQFVTPTSASLLNRLKAAKPDAAEWRRLTEIYLPLIRTWLAQIPELNDEAADLAQEVLIIVVKELPRFERQREGSFCAWLRNVTVNRVRAFTRQRRRRPAVADSTHSFLNELEDPASAISQQWDREHDQHVFQQLISAIEIDFSPATWLAFRRSALDGHPVASVATELGISVNAVLLAKSRVLKKLREAAGLVD